MSTKINVTSTRSFITKSRSGHYTLTIKDVGTWEKDGRTYPYEKVLLKKGLLELGAARALKNQFMSTIENSKTA